MSRLQKVFVYAVGLCLAGCFSPEHPSARESSSRTVRKRKAKTKVRVSKIPDDLLKRLRQHMASVVGRMKRWGYNLDESYCHVGAAYTSAYLSTQNVDAYLFQPLPFHMLSYFDFKGKRYFIDQSMAQFFLKHSPPHKLLLKQGGFFGTPEDFYRFYFKYADHVKEWDDYKNGGFLPTDSKPEVDEVVPYEMWESPINWKKLQARKARARRIVASWYKDFKTDTSHNQGTGLFWTAKYFYNLFQVKLALPSPPYTTPLPSKP